MNFFSIFVALIVVASHRGVDASLRGEYLDLDVENERVELVKHRLKTEHNSAPYPEWIRKPKKMAKHPSEQAILVAAEQQRTIANSTRAKEAKRGHRQSMHCAILARGRVTVPAMM